MLKEKIKKHCIAFSNLPGVTTPNTTLVSVFIVDSVLDYLTHLINNEVRLITRAKDQITILCQELCRSRSFLGDMEVMQDEDLIKQAIQLRDLAYDVEYILAWFVTGEVPVWYIILRLSTFIQMNQLIRNAIPKTKMNDGINKQQVVQSPHQVSSQVSNSTLIDEEIIVGLNDETMEIASQLNGGPNHLQMIFITGMPGLGKTTLAKKVYDYLSRFNHFDQRLWCVASQTCERKRLLIDLLCCMTKRKEDEFLDMEDSDLGQYLYKRLIGRRYLIVMDDIWDMQALNDVKIYFPKDNTRSKVLFTTRNTNLASEASSDTIIKELHLLSADQCWDLLRQKVFGKSLCPPELEQIGMKIAASCKGLPLVVVGIAAVLANMEKNNFNSWQEVLGNLTSYISKNQEILELSYKNLPIHLKPCILYFSAFKEDMEIPVKKLLSLWISEGFIGQDKDKRFEDIAEKYLIELINRNMVQVGKRRSDKRVKACRVHDLMHEMALRIAEQEKFVKVIKDYALATDDDPTLLHLSSGFSLYEQHNRLCNHSYSGEIESRPFGLHIDSLLGIPVSSFNESCLRLVKVLQTEDMKDQIETLRLQLRYLEIPYMLSQTICTSIKNLEFLIVTQQRYIGPAFSCMPKLRHLEFRRSPRFTDHKEFLENDSLETLSGVELRYSNDEDTLKCFPNLRRLKCSYKSPWNHGPDVSFLSRLESLSMIFYTSEVNFMEIKFADNIKKLSLCRASFEIMSSIGRLPNLEVLKLISLDFEGENWNTNDNEFQKLKLLKLSHLKLKDWMITSEDHFPMLEQLVLENCNHLKGIPSKFSDIQTLQMIEVHSCCRSVGESALEIQKTQQEEYGNEELQVIING